MLFCLLVWGSAAGAAETADPSLNSLGARVLGLGKAYVGEADDANAILMNPAGLAQLREWQITSLSTKLQENVNFQQVGLALPTKIGVLGLSYTGGSSDFSLSIATREVGPGGRIVDTTEILSYNKHNQAVLLSYANRLGKLPVSFGITGKMFLVSTGGTLLTGGHTGNGTELDVGMLVQPRDWFRVGISAQDLLPASLDGNAGKLLWDDNVKDTYPAILRTGVSLNVFGRQGLWQRGVQELTANFDAEYKPNGANKPLLFHGGIEWSPLELIALRAGLDQEQDVSTAAISTNFAGGVGLQINKFRFDYAYHQVGRISDLATHYFSLTYGLPTKVKTTAGLAFRILDPLDKFKTEAENITLVGTTLNKAVTAITANGEPAQFKDRGYFSLKVPLVKGRNVIKLIAYDKNKKVLQSLTMVGVRLMTFIDVDPQYWAKEQVDFLKTFDIMIGYPDETVRVEPEITRAEFATLLARLYELPLSSEPGSLFDDVSETYWARPYIEAVVLKRLMSQPKIGYFYPESKLTRAEAVYALVRFSELDVAHPEVVPFADVPVDYWAAPEIAAAKRAGMLKYITGELFLPKRHITRGEVAYMLLATPQGVKKINNLFENSELTNNDQDSRIKDK